MKIKTLEITSYIGCPNMCSYCPQKLLISKYKGKKKMDIDDFKKILSNVPNNVDIHFSGFSEIFFHPNAVEFIKLASKNHKVAIHTTTKGMTEEIIKTLSDIKFKEFVIHKIKGSISIPFVKEVEVNNSNAISRGGNLFKTKKKKKGRGRCLKSSTHERNVVLPNGDVCLCCMDYGLKHKLGNLFVDNYDDLKRRDSYELCKTCEYYQPISLLKQIYSKLITILVLAVICFYHINPVLATNLKSIDLELSSSQYLSITDANQTGLDITGDYSFSFWFKRETTAGYQVLIAKRVNSPSGYYVLNIHPDGYFVAAYATNGASDDVIYTSDDLYQNTSVWYYFTQTTDVSASTIKLYINGSEVNGTYVRQNATAVGDNNSDVRIGAGDDGSGTANNFWDGLMDEVGIWSRVLTPTEVSDIYNSGDGLEYKDYTSALKTNLQAYWKMDNDLLDETANDNDLTNNNSAVFSSTVPFVGTADSTSIPQPAIY